eukprot:1922179-Pyramimonas_sp.AAC.1
MGGRRCDEAGGRSTVIVGRDVNSQLEIHWTEERDLVVSKHFSAKRAAALGPVARDMEIGNGAAFRIFCARALLSVATTFHERRQSH